MVVSFLKGTEGATDRKMERMERMERIERIEPFEREIEERVRLPSIEKVIEERVLSMGLPLPKGVNLLVDR